MATIKISDLHSVELEHQFTALTDDELVSIQGGAKHRKPPSPWLRRLGKVGRVLFYADYIASSVFGW